MKLHTMIKNERGGKKSTSDNTRIRVEVGYKNKIVGQLELYAIVEDLGYSLIWRSEGSGAGSEMILAHEEKGKKQKGECKHDQSCYMECMKKMFD